jgi:hypothetical protein
VTRLVAGELPAGAVSTATPDILPRVTGSTGDPDEERIVTGLLGARPVASQLVRWGFDATSRLVTLETGRRVVVQRREAAPAGGQAGRVSVVIDALRDAGITVPTLLASALDRGHELLVFAMVDGTPGPELLDDPRRGPLLADTMGRTARQLAAIPAHEVLGSGVVPGDGAWSTPTAVRAGCDEWLHALGDDAPRTATRTALEVVTGSTWEVAVSHGDFVPANVLVTDDDGVVLLDLGDVAARHPLLDRAWWLLVVRHHHPDLAPRLAPRLLGASGLAGMAPGARPLPSVVQLPAVALLRAVQLAARRSPGPGRNHHLRLAWTAAAWSAGT